MPEPNSPPSEGGKILLVEDNPTNIDVLYDFLYDRGYEVLVAEDGVSALNRMTHIRPDIILLDIMMPHMDGFEVCRRLKADAETAEIPVIFITAMGAVEDKVKGFQLGAVDYITKPFQNQEILARVRTHLSLTHLRGELVRQNEQLRQQNESLNAYARTVAHDLKNPLNLIMNFARLLEDEGQLTGMQAKDLRAIIESSERMNHIIHDLLLLSQMRRDDVTPVRVDMRSVVEQSLARLTADFHKRGVAPKQPDIWIDAMGIASWLQAVWVNYISNALKYGGEPPDVELFCEPAPGKAGYVRYGVKDNGPGIDSGEIQNVFTEFRRLGGEKAEGHGIGLSIVRRVVERLGGGVGVYNLDPGPGCCFYFDLPAVGP